MIRFVEQRETSPRDMRGWMHYNVTDEEFKYKVMEMSPSAIFDMMCL